MPVARANTVLRPDISQIRHACFNANTFHPQGRTIAHGGEAVQPQEVQPRRSQSYAETAERLGALLRKAGAGEQASYPAKQVECIREFAIHLQTLIDPLVEADAVQKELDVSAFDMASKEAEHEAEQEEKAMGSTAAKHE